MDLKEAIEEVNKYCGRKPAWANWDIHDTHPTHIKDAIATILNAVVKGELKHE